ncbi:hypothetical protein MTBUT4_790001 [Magnetospirillum sp. UT-4]|nr:hypothetical protein MTBUT4_790001 [Magnetospirillum sp. UT-4]
MNIRPNGKRDTLQHCHGRIFKTALKPGHIGSVNLSIDRQRLL